MEPIFDNLMPVGLSACPHQSFTTVATPSQLDFFYSVAALAREQTPTHLDFPIDFKFETPRSS